MATGRRNLIVKQGDTFRFTPTWKDQNEVAVDLTGATATMTIKTDRDASTNILQLTSGSGITLGGSAGTIAIVMTSTQTALFSFTEAIYDVQVTLSTGDLRTILEGNIELIPGVT